MPGIYPPLAGSEWVNRPANRVIEIVVYGLKGDIHVPRAMTFNAAAMPVFGQQVTGSAYNWSDEKIAAVLTYVRQEWGNKAGPVSADDVAAVHKAVGDRKEMSESDLNTRSSKGASAGSGPRPRPLRERLVSQTASDSKSPTSKMLLVD